MCVLLFFLSGKTGTFSANFNIYFMLKMVEMAFPGFKFLKFSGGGCPRTPYRASGHACIAMIRSVYNARSAPGVYDVLGGQCIARLSASNTRSARKFRSFGTGAALGICFAAPTIPKTPRVK